MSTKYVDVMIAGQNYRLAVDEKDETPLLNAVQVVDSEMSRIRNTTNAKGQERIAVMAAIRLASDLLMAKQNRIQCPDTQISAQLTGLAEHIDHVLRDSEQI